MKDEERDLLERLAPGPAPKPPEGLLQRIKDEIPERLPANVRPFRRRIPVTALRIAAALFVVAGALVVVTRGQKEEGLRMPAAEVPAPYRAEAPAPRRAESLAIAPQDKDAEPLQKQIRDEKRDTFSKEKAAVLAPVPEKVESFAPAMPAAPKAALESEDSAEGGAAPLGRRDEPRQNVAERDRESGFADERRETKKAEKPAALAAQEASPPMAVGSVAEESAPAPARRAALRSAGPPATGPARAVTPTPGSLLHALGAAARPKGAAARDGGRLYVLVQLPRARGAEISAAGAELSVLSASVLSGGGLGVLAEAHGPLVATLRAGDEIATASVSGSAPALAQASPDLRLAHLAWRLERARGAHDTAEIGALAREAEALSASDPRAALLVSLAR